MFQLRIEDKILQSVSDFEACPEFSETWAQESIRFCLAWLRGEKTFSLQTSGSTGKPKVISVSRQQMEASARATRSFLGTGKNSRILNALNPEYIAGKMNLVRAMVWKCAILCEPPSNHPIGTAGLEFRPTFVTLVPTQVIELLHRPQKKDSIKHLLIGGAPLSESLKKEIASSGIPAWQSYGMSETVSHIALARITQFPLRYHTLPRVEIGVSEEDALWVRCSMSDSEKIQTKDRVQLVSPTEFYWKGRLDFVINSGGIKLHPEELELKMESIIHEFFPGTEFFLAGEKDEKLGEKLVLLIEGPKIDSKIRADFFKKLKGTLQKFEVPKELYSISPFSRTPSGKINRKATLGQLGLI